MSHAALTDPATAAAAPARTGGRPPGPRLRPAAPVAVAVAAALTLPAVVDAYTISIASTAIVLATLAISTQLLTVAGLPSLGQAAYLGVGAYTAAALATHGLRSGPLQLAAAALAATAAAALCAPLVLRTRGTAFLMTTFAVAELTRTVASQWATVTGGDDGLHTPPVTIWPGTALRADGYVYLYLLGCFLTLCGLVATLMRSRLVLVLRGAADHEPRLGALGHHPTRALLTGHLIAAAVAGAAGALHIATNRYLSPADMGLDVSALALLAAAIGAGSMRGAIAGAVLVVAVRDLAGTPTGGHALALLGAVFLLVAYRRPAWLWLHTWRPRRRT